MESKGTFFILIIVVAVLTLTLAALAGYLFLVQGTPSGNTETGHIEETVEVPEEEELSSLSLNESKKYYNLKNEDPKKIAVIQVSVSLKYFNKRDGIKNMSEMMEAYLPEIRELVTRFFLSITIDEVKTPEAFDKAKAELKEKINELLNEGIEKKQQIVYKVIFDDWLFQ